MSKGQFSGRVGFIVTSVMFIIAISFLAVNLNVDGVSCSDPADQISQPDANTSTFTQVTDSANGLVNILFGCSSSNSLLNGLFLALQAGMVLIVLMILKDVVPFT